MGNEPIIGKDYKLKEGSKERTGKFIGIATLGGDFMFRSTTSGVIIFVDPRALNKVKRA